MLEAHSDVSMSLAAASVTEREHAEMEVVNFLKIFS